MTETMDNEWECDRCGSNLVERVWEGDDARDRHDDGEDPDYIRCHGCGYRKS